MESVGNTRHTQSFTSAPNDWAALDEWARQGDERSGENRAEAVSRIRRFVSATDEFKLDLNGLKLTAMPPLPDAVRKRVTHLDFGHNKIERFDFGNQKFPRLELLEIESNEAKYISGNLPELSELYAGYNRLDSLASLNCQKLELLNLPDNGAPIDSVSGFRMLKILDLGNSDVRYIDAKEMPELEMLEISDARIKSLSGEFKDLARLQTEGCSIKKFDWKNFPALRILGCTFDDPEFLNGLAEHCGQLAMLGVPEEWRDDLPEGLQRLVANGQLEVHEFEELDQILRDGSDSDLDDASDGESSEAGPEGNLTEAVAYWRNGQSARKWERISTEENAARFAGFLSELKNTKEAQLAETSDDFQRRVQRLLAAVADNPALRATVFAMAAGERNNCDDRRTNAFADLEMEVFNHNLEKIAANGGDGVLLARDLHRLHCNELLQNFILGYISQRKAENRNAAIDEGITDENELKRRESKGIDEVDVYLAFRYRISQTMTLPVNVQAMRYERAAGIMDTDLSRAEQEVKRRARDIEAFATFMATNAAWSIYLRNAHTEKFDKLVDTHCANGDGGGDHEAKANEYAVAEYELKLELTREWLKKHPSHAAFQSALGKRAAPESAHALQARLNMQLDDQRRQAVAAINDRDRRPAIPQTPSGPFHAPPANPSYFTGFGGFDGFGSQPGVHPGTLGSARLPGMNQAQRRVSAPVTAAVTGAARESDSASDHGDALPGTDSAKALQWLSEKLGHPNGLKIHIHPALVPLPDFYNEAVVLRIVNQPSADASQPENIIVRLRALSQMSSDIPLDVEITLVQLLRAWNQRDGYELINAGSH